MTNIDVKGGIEKALKSITVSDLNESVLSPQQFQRFLDGLQEKSNFLSDARLQEMYSQVVKIDRMEFEGRVMEQGTNADGSQNIPDGAKPTFKTNTLTAKELISITGLNDDAARRNIAKGSLENYLLTAFSEATAFDLAEYCVFADKDSDDEFLAQTDGWVKRAGNKVYGVETPANVETGAPAVAADFNPASITSVLDSMIAALPKRAIRNRAEVPFKLNFEAEEALREHYAQRGTNLGDQALTSAGNLAYKGFPVVRDAVLDSAPASVGRVAILGNPKNFVYGVFHKVTLEKDRVPKGRKTDFVLTVEVDANYDNENAVVVAFLDQAKA